MKTPNIRVPEPLYERFAAVAEKTDGRFWSSYRWLLLGATGRATGSLLRSARGPTALPSDGWFEVSAA